MKTERRRAREDGLAAALLLLLAVLAAVQLVGVAWSDPFMGIVTWRTVGWPSGFEGRLDFDWDAPPWVLGPGPLDAASYLDQVRGGVWILAAAGLFLLIAILAAARAALRARGRLRCARDIGPGALRAERLDLDRIAALPARVGTLALTVALLVGVWCVTQDRMNALSLLGLLTTSDIASTPWGSGVTFAIGGGLALLGHLASAAAGFLTKRSTPGDDR